MNRQATNKETESVIKNITTLKPKTNSFTDEFYLTLKETLIPIFLKMFQNMEEILNQVPNMEHMREKKIEHILNHHQ